MLSNNETWQPVISLRSDHLPIVVSKKRLLDFITFERCTFLAHGKDHWPHFKDNSDIRAGIIKVATV